VNRATAGTAPSNGVPAPLATPMGLANESRHPPTSAVAPKKEGANATARVLLSSMADEELLEFPRAQLRLTRSEAARYVGASGESTIRAAEANGLICEQDDDGQSWHSPRVLDAWKWRTKSPSAAQKTRVLREATKSRSREMKERERRLALELERQANERDAEWAREEARQTADDALRETVRGQNEERRAAFELHHMDETTAGRALEFSPHEARYRLRDLVSRGLLRRFDSPNEVRFEWSLDGARAVETHWPICGAGPFFLRDDVLELRREATALAAGIVGREPGGGRNPEYDDLLATLLGLVLARIGGTSRPDSSSRL
jgi:hypothetical protein